MLPRPPNPSSQPDSRTSSSTDLPDPLDTPSIRIEGSPELISRSRSGRPQLYPRSKSWTSPSSPSTTSSPAKSSPPPSSLMVQDAVDPKHGQHDAPKLSTFHGRSLSSSSISTSRRTCAAHHLSQNVSSSSRMTRTKSLPLERPNFVQSTSPSSTAEPWTPRRNLRNTSILSARRQSPLRRPLPSSTIEEPFSSFNSGSLDIDQTINEHQELHFEHAGSPYIEPLQSQTRRARALSNSSSPLIGSLGRIPPIPEHAETQMDHHQRQDSLVLPILSRFDSDSTSPRDHDVVSDAKFDVNPGLLPVWNTFPRSSLAGNNYRHRRPASPLTNISGLEGPQVPTAPGISLHPQIPMHPRRTNTGKSTTHALRPSVSSPSLTFPANMNATGQFSYHTAKGPQKTLAAYNEAYPTPFLSGRAFSSVSLPTTSLEPSTIPRSASPSRRSVSHHSTLSASSSVPSISIPSTPTSIRSRSPSISSLETIPDTPDAEAQAERVTRLKSVIVSGNSILGASTLGHSPVSPSRNVSTRSIGPAKDRLLTTTQISTNRHYPSPPASPRRRLSGSTSDVNLVGARPAMEPQKRWSVCGAEHRSDFDLETIWEDGS